MSDRASGKDVSIGEGQRTTSDATILAIEAEAAPPPLDGLREAARHMLNAVEDPLSAAYPLSICIAALHAALRDDGETK